MRSNARSAASTRRRAPQNGARTARSRAAHFAALMRPNARADASSRNFRETCATMRSNTRFAASTRRDAPHTRTTRARHEM
eukprot:4438563-Lingulodinium_polyedra.AAC.1